MSSIKKTCIYCGRQIGETEDYAEGRVMNGSGWGCMCMECASGDGAKYFDGSYGDQRRTWEMEHPELKKPRKKKEPFTFDMFCEICSAIVVGLGFIITFVVIIIG